MQLVTRSLKVVSFGGWYGAGAGWVSAAAGGLLLDYGDGLGGGM